MASRTVAATRPPASRTFRAASRLFNQLAMLVAGTRWLPLYGVITHRGRRSGNYFQTPVVVRPFKGGFIVPMPWGEGTDWYRNVRAAGECMVRWNGKSYRVSHPEVVDTASVAEHFGSIQRAALSRFGIVRCLRLTVSQ
jgi:deazaflavin-dependent oxidoreductase (nitroreductase family)